MKPAIACYVLFFMSLANLSSAATIEDIVGDISEGQGKVTHIHKGNKTQIFVFEERHTSRIGQIEIAHMIVRLINKYGLNQVALEGALKSEDRLNPRWTNIPDNKSILPVTAQLLGEGEINSAEFIAGVFSDVHVRGIEDAEEYNVSLGDKASGAGLMYLIKIAEVGLTQNQINRINRLANNDRIDEALDLMMSFDPWIQDMYANLTSRTQITSAEKMLQQLKAIEAKANSNNIDISAEVSQNMSELKQFFQTASERSDTMVKETLRMANSSSSQPIAMIIGAAHTERVVELLDKANVSYAIIRPWALANNDTIGDLNMEAYSRKLEGQSIGSSGSIGSIIDGRKKPKLVINKTWAKSKANLYYLTTKIVHMVNQGNEPPYITENELENLQGIRMDPKLIEIEDGEIVFPVQVLNENNRWERLWIRSAYIGEVERNVVDTEIENRIDALIAEASGGGRDGGRKNGNVDQDALENSDNSRRRDNRDGGNRSKVREGAIRISPKVYMTAGKTKSAIQNTITAG